MNITTYLVIAAVAAVIVGILAVERNDKPVAYALQCAGVGLLVATIAVVGWWALGGGQ